MVKGYNLNILFKCWSQHLRVLRFSVYAEILNGVSKLVPSERNHQSKEPFLICCMLLIEQFTPRKIQKTDISLSENSLSCKTMETIQDLYCTLQKDICFLNFIESINISLVKQMQTYFRHNKLNFYSVFNPFQNQLQATLTMKILF